MEPFLCNFIVGAPQDMAFKLSRYFYVIFSQEVLKKANPSNLRHIENSLCGLGADAASIRHATRMIRVLYTKLPVDECFEINTFVSNKFAEIMDILLPTRPTSHTTKCNAMSDADLYNLLMTSLEATKKPRIMWDLVEMTKRFNDIWRQLGLGESQIAIPCDYDLD